MESIPEHPCPVCGGVCLPHDSVDFNKSCLEQKGMELKPSGIQIPYCLCETCGFCFSPEIVSWTLAEFEQRIYNRGYEVVDPDYVMRRPHLNHHSLMARFGKASKQIRHLDYGGGNGYLSKLLRESGWASMSYDPFVNRDVDISTYGKFDFITAFEVFEHVPNVDSLMSALRALLAPQGVILFSTLISNGHIEKGKPLTWWYASPRNGHISLFTKESLATLAKRYQFNYGRENDNIHYMWASLPDWILGLPPFVNSK